MRCWNADITIYMKDFQINLHVANYLSSQGTLLVTRINCNNHMYE